MPLLLRVVSCEKLFSEIFHIREIKYNFKPNYISDNFVCAIFCIYRTWYRLSTNGVSALRAQPDVHYIDDESW